MEENLPPGFRFHPTDEELITCYLSHKVSDFSFTSRAIVDVDLNKCEPWDLPAKASMGEKEWYFFNLRDRKYPTGMRTNRATEAGYWKTTGNDKEIFRASVLVGMKKTLVFYRGRAPKGEKTNWVMHEYRLDCKQPFKPSKEEWVVCRVFHKSSSVKKLQQRPSSQPSLQVDSPNCDTNTTANEYGEIELLNSNTFANSSSAISDISDQNYKGNNNVNMNIDMNMNWAAAREAASLIPSLQWPSSSLINPNISMNSLLLSALQLRNGTYQPRADTNSNYSIMPQGISHFGADFGSDFMAASSSKVLDSVQQPRQDQPFNLDSIW